MALCSGVFHIEAPQLYTSTLYIVQNNVSWVWRKRVRQSREERETGQVIKSLSFVLLQIARKHPQHRKQSHCYSKTVAEISEISS